MKKSIRIVVILLAVLLIFNIAIVSKLISQERKLRKTPENIWDVKGFDWCIRDDKNPNPLTNEPIYLRHKSIPHPREKVGYRLII